MSPNRIVALYTPFIFAPLAGLIAAWLAEHVPGANIAQDQLDVVFIVGMLIALAMAAQWLHGWQKWEARNDLELAVAARGFPDQAPTVVVDDGGAVDEVAFDVSDDEDIDEFDDSLDYDEFEDTSVEEEPVAAGT